LVQVIISQNTPIVDTPYRCVHTYRSASDAVEECLPVMCKLKNTVPGAKYDLTQSEARCHEYVLDGRFNNVCSLFIRTTCISAGRSNISFSRMAKI
jgi:hypothetical protein